MAWFNSRCTKKSWQQGLGTWRQPAAKRASARPSVETLEDRHVPTTITDPKAYIGNLYIDILGRRASDAEVAPWAIALPQLGPTAVADVFVNCHEAHVHEVDIAYQTYLGRHADWAGAQGWGTLLDRGERSAAIVDQIVASDEYFNRVSGASNDKNASLIAAYYRAILGRQASTNEINAWAAAIPTMGRVGVAAQFTNAVEYRSHLITVEGYYQVLHRDWNMGNDAAPVIAEAFPWAFSALDLPTIRVIFAASDERISFSSQVVVDGSNIHLENDILYVSGTSLADRLEVGSTALILDVSDARRSIWKSFSPQDFRYVRFDGGDGDDVLRSFAGTRVAAYGGDGNDSLTGGDGNDRLYGGAGDDTLEGGDGDDYLVGDDPLRADVMGQDSLDGGAGNDVLYGNGGDDTLVSGDGVDVLDGGAGDDSLEGGQGIDRFVGNEGDDTIVGGRGISLIYGGNGNDDITGGIGLNIISCDDGDDHVEVAGLGVNYVFGGDGDDNLVGGFGPTFVDGGDGDDVLTAVFDSHILLGGPGRDTLWGGNWNDYLNGGDGDRDYVDGGNGDDVVLGGDGDFDILVGGTGNDLLDGGAGWDNVLGGDGNDLIYYGSDDWAAAYLGLITIDAGGGQNNQNTGVWSYVAPNATQMATQTNLLLTPSQVAIPAGTDPALADLYQQMARIFSAGDDASSEFGLGDNLKQLFNYTPSTMDFASHITDPNFLYGLVTRFPGADAINYDSYIGITDAHRQGLAAEDGIMARSITNLTENAGPPIGEIKWW